MSDDARTLPDPPQPPQRDIPDEAIAGGRLLLGWVLIAIAVIMLFGGWLGVSRNPEVARQLAYFVSGGLGGMLAGIIGVGLLISDDVRKDRARLGRLEASVLELHQLLQGQAEALQDLAPPTNGTAKTPRKATRRG